MCGVKNPVYLVMSVGDTYACCYDPTVEDSRSGLDLATCQYVGGNVSPCSDRDV